MKPRLTALDLLALLPQLRADLLHARLANAYDGPGGGTKSFVLKFGKSGASAIATRSTDHDHAEKENEESDRDDDESEASGKKLLLVDAGSRLHLVPSYSSTGFPSGFAMKLRKHLKKRRVSDVRMMGGFERVAEIVFGEGEYACGWKESVPRVFSLLCVD